MHRADPPPPARPAPIRRRTVLRVVLVALIGLTSLGAAPFLQAGDPSWWAASEAFPPSADDEAMLDQEHFRKLILRVYVELQANLPSDIWTNPAAASLTSFVSGLPPVDGPLDPVPTRQLEHAALEFYELLVATGHATKHSDFPRHHGPRPEDPVTIGQAKAAFAFDPAALHGTGIPGMPGTLLPAPPAPTDVSTDNSTPGEIRIFWRPSPGATHYVIRFSPGNKGFWAIGAVVRGTDAQQPDGRMSWIYSGGEPGAICNFSVAALCWP